MTGRVAELYFESHVTIEPVFDSDLERVARLAEQHGFRVADLLMQKRKEDRPERSRNDTFCTGHGKELRDIEERTRRLIFDLQVFGYKVWRYKIEDTVLDSRHDDVWGVLDER
jgi:hypothetical protein